MESELPKSTVYFDGSCSLCRAEIGYCRRKDQERALCFVDISETSAATSGRNYPRACNEALPCSRKRWACFFRRGGIRRGLDSFAQMALGSERRVPAGGPDCPGVGLQVFSSGPTVHLPFPWASSATSGRHRRSQALMTGQFEPEGATGARVDLGSFPQAGVAVVFGAGGGIGGALVEAIKAAEKFKHVVSFSRSTSPAIDLLDEGSLARSAAFSADQGELRLVIDATGFLHDELQGPEKSWRQLDAASLARAFALNAIGPALIMKHMLPRLPRSGKSVFATLSARVGSIGDNRLGGWYSYRDFESRSQSTGSDSGR